jgi:hypothetical protein
MTKEEHLWCDFQWEVKHEGRRSGVAFERLSRIYFVQRRGAERMISAISEQAKASPPPSLLTHKKVADHAIFEVWLEYSAARTEYSLSVQGYVLGRFPTAESAKAEARRLERIIKHRQALIELMAPTHASN